MLRGQCILVLLLTALLEVFLQWLLWKMVLSSNNALQRICQVLVSAAGVHKTTPLHLHRKSANSKYRLTPLEQAEGGIVRCTLP